MTKKEAIYWKKFIEKIINERLPLMTPGTEEAIAISQFASQHMATITGQQMLPQYVFREFLDLFANIPVIQERIEQAQAEIDEWLLNLPTECTEAEIYAMWDEEEPESKKPLILDSDDYIVVTDSVVRDEDGYMVLPEPALDSDGYIEVSNQ